MKKHFSINSYFACMSCLVAILVNAKAHEVIPATGETAQNKLFYPSDPKFVTDPHGVLIPSFLVKNILDRLDSKKDFEVVSNSYMEGFSKELAQIITGNEVVNYRSVRREWYRNGAEDAKKLAQDVASKGVNIDYAILSKFGYQRISIYGSYNILGVLKYNENKNQILIYLPKNISDDLGKKILAGEKDIDVVFTGWLSPLGDFYSEAGQVTRMMVVENLLDSNTRGK